MPCARSSGSRAGDEVIASTRTVFGSWRTARTPTSPQPTTKTRTRRKRAGSAPSGFRFEGKIGGCRKTGTMKNDKRKDTDYDFLCDRAAEWPRFHDDR